MLNHLTACATGRACLMVNTVMENATADPDIADVCRGSHDHLVRGLEATVARCVERGEFPPDTDVPTTATMIAAQVYGLSVLSPSSQPPRPRRRCKQSLNFTLP